MISQAVNKLNGEVLEVVENQLKQLLCCIDGYNKSMSIENTLDLLNKEDKWIECKDEDGFRKYILKDRKMDRSIAEFVCKWSIGDFNWDTYSVEGKMWISDIIEY